MATSRNVMVAPLLMILAGMQVCSGENYTSAGYKDECNIISGMQGFAQAIECFGGIMQGLPNAIVERLAKIQGRNEGNNQKVEELQQRLDTSEKENKEYIRKVEELQHRLETLEKENKENISVSKVEEADKKLKKSLIGELKEGVKLQNKTVLKMELDERCSLENRNEIRRAVQEYDRTKAAGPLRNILNESLDHGSLAYRQLQDIADNKYPAYNTGYRGHKDLAEVLVYCGGGVDMTDSDGYTMLNAAANGNRRGMVKFLLDSGADTNIGTKDGRHTPLMYAAVQGYMAIVKLLVQAGTDTTIRDGSNRTALEEATLHNQMEVSEYLSQFPH